jgi:hypothetical protein
MAVVKISELVALTAPAADDILIVNDVSEASEADITKKIRMDDIVLFEASQLSTGIVTNTKIGADAVDGSKIADDSIDSEHYVNGSIDTAHIANGQINSDKLATDAVTSTKIDDKAVSSNHAGYRIPILKNRQGGSSTSWNTSGTTDREDLSIYPEIQVGSIAGNSSLYGSVTFPDAFSAIPLIFLSAERGIASSGVTFVYYLVDCSTTGFTFSVRKLTTSGSAYAELSDDTDIRLHWLAIGHLSR